jgi:hypothetical protein
MNNTLKTLSQSLCKPVLDGLKITPKSHTLTFAFGKVNLITAMHHVMGFDGVKLERVQHVNEEALKKYTFFLIRPFYHKLQVTIMINRGTHWDKFAHITRHRADFEKQYLISGAKALPKQEAWINAVLATNITKLKPPKIDTLPRMFDIITRFSPLMQQGALGKFVIQTMDAMTRSSDIANYVRASMSVARFESKVTPEGITLQSDLENSTIRINFTEVKGKPPVEEHLGSTAKISAQLKSLRDDKHAEYASFYDTVMLRALKNALVIVPIEGYKLHAVEFQHDNVEEAYSVVFVTIYMTANDGRSYIRVCGSIEVNK